MSDLHQRLEFATQLAYKAGDIMLKHFQIGIAKEDKSDGSPITIADKEVNNMVIEEIKKAYPQESVLGEEASNIKEGAEHVWACDPIDGTIPYTFGVPISQFSLAFVKDGKPIVGVIYDPYMKRLYHAIIGEGAFVNDQALHVNKHKTLRAGKYFGLSAQKTPLMDAGGFIHALHRRDMWSYIALCYTHEAMLVASGQLVGSISEYRAAHDIAAVKVIVEEAGGKVTDLLGNEQRYDQPIKGALISNELVHEELVNLVKPFLKIS